MEEGATGPISAVCSPAQPGADAGLEGPGSKLKPMIERKTLTLRQIAKLAGTSKSTVSRVLSGNPRISEATRHKVMRVIEKHHYHPNELARSLARGRSGLISVISANIGSGFFADVIRGIDLMATENRIRLLCTFAHSVEDYLTELRAVALGGQVEGVVLVAPYVDLFDHELASSVPVVLCAARPGSDAGAWSRCDGVTLDNEKAVLDLVQHLVEQGFRKIVHLAGWPNNFDAVEREQAFRKAMRRYPEVPGEVITCGLIREDGQRTAREYVVEDSRREVTAFVAVNDSTALGFVDVCKERWPGAPWPVAITGWDNTPLAEALGLTSVDIPTYELGEEAARLLLNRVAGGAAAVPVHSRVGQAIRVRDSSLRRGKPHSS